MYIHSCDQLLLLFTGHVRRVYFREDAQPPKFWTVMTMVELEKPKPSG
jgi:hypothetical protein